MARLTGSDDLYRLIHSLTPEEKGYFKKYAMRHTSQGNNYLELFDAINRQKEFDEKPLKKKYKTGYAGMKVYLFDMLLDALTIAEGTTTASVAVLKGMVKIQILIKKGLYEKALKQNTQYLKLAEANELYGHMSMLLKNESNLLRQTIPVNTAIKGISEYREKIKQAHILQQNTDEMLCRQHLLAAMARIKNYGSLTNADKEAMDIDYLRSPQNALSPLAEKLRLVALNYYYRIENDNRSLYETTKRVVALEKANWLKLKSEAVTDDYLKAINNLVSAALAVAEYTHAGELIESLLEVPIQSKQLLLENNIRYTHLKQYWLWRVGKHKEGAAFSEDMISKNQLLHHFPFQWNKIMAIVGAKALFEFSEGQYQQAMRTLLFFQPSVTDKYGLEMKKSVEFLQLLIQFEIGNYSLIKPLTTSIKNRITDLNEQEKLLLQSFVKHHSNPTVLYENLIAQCPQILLRPLLSIENWAISKQQRKPLSEVMRLYNLKK